MVVDEDKDGDIDEAPVSAKRNPGADVPPVLDTVIRRPILQRACCFRMINSHEITKMRNPPAPL